MELRSTSWLPRAGNGSGPVHTPFGCGRIRYFKRFRMEADLDDFLPRPALPAGYQWLPWDAALLESHADALFASFQGEIDAVVFSSLGTRNGCAALLREVTRRPGFTPEATWLVARAGEFCATVQGVRERSGLGAIQNLGVAPAHRGQGLGGALLLRALGGFFGRGHGRVYLEVTAENEGAVRLYRRHGFRRRKTLYKAVDVVPTLQGAS